MQHLAEGRIRFDAATDNRLLTIEVDEAFA